MKHIKGKKALVTGAASGIGRAIALALADAGTDVFLVDIDAEKLSQTAAQCGERGVVVVNRVCDLRFPDQITTMTQDVLDRWDGVDILINNAGIAYYGKTENMTAEQWDRLLAVNLHAPIQITRELLPSLMAREQSHIVNVCSFLGLVGGKRLAAYQTTKFALVGFSKCLRAEFARYRLGVTALCPGFVRTGIYQSAETNDARPIPRPPRLLMFTTPERVAAAAIRAIRRNRSVATVTLPTRLVWWFDRLVPWLYDFFQRRPWNKKQRTKPTATLRQTQGDALQDETRVPARQGNRI